MFTNHEKKNRLYINIAGFFKDGCATVCYTLNLTVYSLKYFTHFTDPSKIENLRCIFTLQVFPGWVCYTLNYTVCSLDETCSIVQRTSSVDGESSGSFTDPGMNIPFVWYHRILLSFTAINAEPVYGLIEIRCK